MCVLHTRVYMHMRVPRILRGFNFRVHPIRVHSIALCMRGFATHLFLFRKCLSNAIPLEPTYANHQPCTRLRGWKQRVRLYVCALTDCESVCAWRILPLAACECVCARVRASARVQCVCVRVHP